MDGVQGELFELEMKEEYEIPPFLGDNVIGESMLRRVKYFVPPIKDYICPICKGTGYTKGIRCVCSED